MKSHVTDEQRVELHNYLKTHGSATTTGIRHELDILAPSPRIFELRHKQNLNIVTTWDIAYNPGGDASQGSALYLNERNIYGGSTMSTHKKRQTTFAESNASETAHLEPVNNPYFNMILNNQECAKFCCDLLQKFDDLLAMHCPDNPKLFKGNELHAFVTLYKLNQQYGREL